MATSSASSTGVQSHFRSISLPSRLHSQQYSIIKFESQLNNLKTWETSLASTQYPSSSDTVKTGLVGLAELYNCFEELVHSPITQQALLQHQSGEVAVLEEALEGSIGLLDSCSVARDFMSTIKEHVQDLESALRRKGGGDIERSINGYTCCRKEMRKEITTKCLRALKQMENKIGSSPSPSPSPVLESNHYFLSMMVIREVASITVSVLRSVLLFLAAPAPKTKPSGWSLISKLMVTRPSDDQGGNKIFNEVGAVDLALRSLDGCIRSNELAGRMNDVQMAATRRLQALDGSIEGFEDELDCLFRCLIKNRVSLLNILVL